MNEEQLRTKINELIKTQTLREYLLNCLKKECELNNFLNLNSSLIYNAWHRLEKKIENCQQIEIDLPNELILRENTYFLLTTRQGENEVRSRGARDRRALTGEAGNASRRQVIVGDVSMNSVRDECTSDAGRSGLNIGHVMQTNFGDTTAEILREHSDSLVYQIGHRNI